MNNNLIIELKDEQGNLVEKEIALTFICNERQYAALLPNKKDKENQDTEDKEEIELVRLTIEEYGNEKLYIVETIYNKLEMAEAKIAFEKELYKVIAENRENEENNQVEEPNILQLTFTDDRGVKSKWNVIDTFEYKKKDYVAMSPDSLRNSYNEAEIYLMRLEYISKKKTEECKVTPIASDTEYNEVSRYFQMRVQDKL